MTKQAFLANYRARLLVTYIWASVPEKLERFMAGVAATLAGDKTWNHTGECVECAWHMMGGKGKPTLKALRALPES